ncbi:MAG TPA: HoxN/HupN/NixA family nickel/cobalt transporter [Tepidisphaeraceae bacterium]|nr:HoxN/HupN/NixA family nickel/cobalt transporter [Tepidisphaeraceae bacterium]
MPNGVPKVSEPAVKAAAIAPAVERSLTNVRRASAATILMLLLFNAAAWITALLVFHHMPVMLGTALLAWTFGLQHALDADHISAIDNVTRKLMQEGQRPTMVGFFFSLGHSTIVILLSIAIAATAAAIKSRFDQLENIGGLVGTIISAAFLAGIAAVNLVVLRNIVRTFNRVRRGEKYEDQNLDTMLSQMGRIGRWTRPAVRLLDRSWKMYAVGFLFGLGFDTATQVGLLGISAALGAQAMAIWSILIFPILFTAGMCLVDTLDGLLMLGAYGWAFVHPIRKLYYNMTITAVSVLIALAVGAIEILGVLQSEYSPQGWFWDSVGSLNDDYHFKLIGVVIVGIFLVSWATSAVVYRMMGYHLLEVPTDGGPVGPTLT